MNVLEDSCGEFSSPQTDATCHSIRTLYFLVMVQMLKFHLKIVNHSKSNTVITLDVTKSNTSSTAHDKAD